MQMYQENLKETPDESETEDDEDQRTLFCANVDERVTEDILYELFLQAGPVESARIPKDRNGKQRTFAFITYVHKSSVPYALQLYQGLSLFRKTLTIKYKGNTQPSPIRNYTSPGCSTNPTNDNSSIRGNHYSSYEDSPLQNPFRSNSADYLINAGKHLDNISKHTSSQRRSHMNANPYQRHTGGNNNNDRERDQNRRRHFNNGSNRHSDQRSSGKNRR